MSKVRRVKKSGQHNYTGQFAEMKRCLEEQQEILKCMADQLEEHHKVILRFDSEYKELKRNKKDRHLLNYIKLRDAILEELEPYEKHRQTNTRGYAALSRLVDELEEMMEDAGIEIIETVPGTKFDPVTEHALVRVPAFREEDNGCVCKVYGCGYRWNTTVLKKIGVDVCIYK